MASSTAAYRNQAQVLPDDENETPYSAPKFQPKSRRNSPFYSLPSPYNSSSSRSPSFHDPIGSPIFSPTIPLKFSSGIPFSWEQTPGIPKNEISNKKKSSNSLLPLPPAGGGGNSSNSFRKGNDGIRKDPFVTALMECSKDDDDDDDDDDDEEDIGYQQHQGFEKIYKTSRISKGFADRLAAMAMATSCKSVGMVSESMIFLPRSRHQQVLAKRRHRSELKRLQT